METWIGIDVSMETLDYGWFFQGQKFHANRSLKKPPPSGVLDLALSLWYARSSQQAVNDVFLCGP